MDTKSFFSNWIVRNILLAVALLAALVIVVSVLLSLVTQHGRTITVPDFTNMTYGEARKVAASDGVKLFIADSVYVKRLRPGVVYLQTPKAGSTVKKGRVIRLTTNTKVAKVVAMPSLVGFTLRQAKAEVLRNGLVLGRLIYVDDIATDNVLRQQSGGIDIAPGRKIVSGTTINLVLGRSSYDSTVKTPDLVGRQYLTAVDLIHENSLNVGRLSFDSSVRTYADSVAASVRSQSPPAGQTVTKGAELTLHLSAKKQ